MKKTLIILATLVAFGACKQTQKPLQSITIPIQHYPDYPPIVVRHHAEAAFDSVRWIFYKQYGCEYGYSWYKLKVPLNERCDDKDFYGKILPSGNLCFSIPADSSIIVPNLPILSYPIDVDTIVTRNDTIHFVIKAAVNDSLYCGYFKYLNTGIPISNNNIGFSIDKQRVVYDLVGNLFSHNGLWDDVQANREATTKLIECTCDAYQDSVPINPWLLQEMKRRAWLK